MHWRIIDKTFSGLNDISYSQFYFGKNKKYCYRKFLAQEITDTRVLFCFLYSLFTICTFAQHFLFLSDFYDKKEDKAIQ